MEHIKCTIEKIYYQDANNYFSVIGVTIDGEQFTRTIVGNNLQEIQPGMVIDAYGDWKDSKYGKQFKVISWQEALPTSLVGMERYLGSGLIKGIGPTIAKKIVAHFGLQSFDVIDNDIKRLKEIPDIGTKRIESIRDCWAKQKEIREVMVFLQSLGVSSGIATSIFQIYGKDSINKIKENPYCLIEDVRGIGFKTADEIAMKMGISKNDPMRCKHGILSEMNKAITAGHVFAEESELFSNSKDLLETDEKSVAQVLYDMINGKELIEEGNAIYLPTYYYAEKGVANRMKALCNEHVTVGKLEVDAILEQGSIVYDDVQKEAINAALHNNVMVMTGCPGTGKSVTTLGIISVLKAMGKEILLAAPTGRAAKRLSQATGMEAKTIHRLLEIDKDGHFVRNVDNPLEGDALIVDEASMIDILLMYSLLKAVPDNMRLILVGDVDQLPSVGAGTVLQDIIESRIAPVVRLTKIFRQAQGSDIITNAHLVNQGIMPQLANDNGSDFMFYNIHDDSMAMTKILELIKQQIPQNLGFSHSDIQVLSPMQNGKVGVRNLNIELQKALNPVGDYLYGGGYQYRKGDRVMQIRNNYDKEVFNGDIGFVSEVDMDERSLTVIYEGRAVEYEDNELDEVTLAYATTIHKSQGSEYPVVVIPLLMTHFVMLQRNLVYTGITRAKKICIIVGTTKALAYSVHNMVVLKRNTKLKERLTT